MVNTSSASVPLAIGTIAARLNCPIHQVRYVIESRNIRPLGRVGNSRVFSEADFELIASILQRIQAGREGGGL